MGDTRLLCDFCSAPDPAWCYPARTFVAYCTPTVVGESVGAWAACDQCQALIEADDRRGLAQRSLDELIRKHPEASAAAGVLHEELTALHREFFEHRSGPPVRVVVHAV